MTTLDEYIGDGSVAGYDRYPTEDQARAALKFSPHLGDYRGVWVLPGAYQDTPGHDIQVHVFTDRTYEQITAAGGQCVVRVMELTRRDGWTPGQEPTRLDLEAARRMFEDTSASDEARMASLVVEAIDRMTTAVQAQTAVLEQIRNRLPDGMSPR